jgi:hypothetical protein
MTSRKWIVDRHKENKDSLTEARQEFYEKTHSDSYLRAPADAAEPALAFLDVDREQRTGSKRTPAQQGLV